AGAPLFAFFAKGGYHGSRERTAHGIGSVAPALRITRADEGGPLLHSPALLCGNKIELARRLFVENGALFLISAAPLFVSARRSRVWCRPELAGSRRGPRASRLRHLCIDRRP